jgi:hypothetical protein
MKPNHALSFLPALLTATALGLATSAGAQTPAGPAPAATSPQTATTATHHKDAHKAGPAKAKHPGDMKAECDALMAKQQEMHDKLKAMDAAMDKLVAAMNAAKSSTAVDALEKPMTAVINELVVQRTALFSMMMEMHPLMMKHTLHHMTMHGTKGAMACPMMKAAPSPDPKAQQK